MLSDWQKRLIIYNVSVFLAVLTIFCVAFYLFSISSFNESLRQKLVAIADSAISSIDYDGAEQGQPDLIVSVLPDSCSPSLLSMRLQWFKPDGKLDIEKGNMPLQLPLKRQQIFETQNMPPALVFTKPAVKGNEVLGYVRVGHPLDEIRKSEQSLLQGLLLSLLAASGATVVGVFFLVRESMKPVRDVILRLQQFCADAAHEMRTPITAVKTNAAVALKHSDALSEGDKLKFENILSGAIQMQNLADDLLLLARSEQITDQQSNELESIELKPMVNKLLVESNIGSEIKQMHLNNLVPDEFKLRFGREDLECILRNLISNAIKYTPDGGSVTVSVSNGNGSYKIAVTDTGIGIAKADQAKVFERFWRADKARTHNSGTGLGLSITRAIAHKYKGSVSVQSDPDQGSTFTVKIPSFE